MISVTKIEHGISPPILSESAAGCESYDCKLALQDFAPTNTGKSSRHCSRDLGVQGKTAKRHTSAEFIVFLRELVKKARWAKQIHSVLDNLSAQKTRAVEEFLEQNPKMRFHFTPTYSSWLNQVELWFAKIQRDVRLLIPTA